MKVNLREIIHYIDESTLEKAKNEKVQKQESPSKMSKDVEESVDKMLSNRMKHILNGNQIKIHSHLMKISRRNTRSFWKHCLRNKRKCLRSIVMKYLPAEQKQKSFSIAWV